MSAILRFAFDDLGMNKVYIQLFTSNEKGLRLWTKMGFQVEGTLRAHYLLDGTFHDMVSLSLLGAEWRG